MPKRTKVYVGSIVTHKTSGTLYTVHAIGTRQLSGDTFYIAYRLSADDGMPIGSKVVLLASECK